MNQVEGNSCLPVLYRDEHLVAVHKPAGLLVHRSPIDRHETRFAVQLVRNQLGRHVYPLHRLDKPTSGVLVFALDPETARLMGEAIATGGMEKTYLAVVRGVGPDYLELHHPLVEEDGPACGCDRPPEPREAITWMRRLAQVELPFAVPPHPCSRYSLMELMPRTGRRHQLRRHMKHLFHPIIGDTTHGDGRHNRLFREQFQCRQLLLAAIRVALDHPVTGQRLVIECPPDEGFLAILKRFGWSTDS